MTRRNFLLFAADDAYVYAAPKAVQRTDDLSYAAPRSSETPAIPGTADSRAAFSATCVGCGLCVKNCPRHVLKFATRSRGALQPALDFRLGWCPPECHTCGEICPLGALKPVEEGRKRLSRLGVAVWHAEHCLVATKGVACDACLRHCPEKAISHDAERRPVVNAAACIGCGACEFHCPARPATGMQVEGVR